MSPSEYRSLADEYREQGRDADADICEIMAQEAERLARYSPSADELPDEDEEPPRVVMTKDGPQALLPTFDAPPVVAGDTTQLTFF